MNYSNDQGRGYGASQGSGGNGGGYSSYGGGSYDAGYGGGSYGGGSSGGYGGGSGGGGYGDRNSRWQEGSRGSRDDYQGGGSQYGDAQYGRSQGGRGDQGSDGGGSGSQYGQSRGRGEDAESSDQVVKVVEILAQSERGWDDAARRAVAEASKTIRNIRSLYIKDMQAVVRDGEIVQFRITAKLSFVLDSNRAQGSRGGSQYQSRGDR